MLIAVTAGRPILAEPIVCEVYSKDLAKEVAKLRDREACSVGCHGCGCKGGPGYRDRFSNECVSWATLITDCGPPPHNDCSAECAPVARGCSRPDLDAARALLRKRKIQLKTKPHDE